MKHVLISFSTKQTIDLGKKLSKVIKSGDIICLRGELGSGKTTFIKGIAKGLNINEITSPSFVIVKEYKIKNGKFCHIDLYRLTQKDFFYSGLEEYLSNKNICAIEWPEKIDYIINFILKKQKNYLEIKISIESKNKRKIEFITNNKRFLKIIKNDLGN